MADAAHDKALDLIRKYDSTDLNEADTRHQIIDEVLHSVLSIPVDAIKCESFINPGFSDYRLQRPNGEDLLFIEAKKTGEYFTLPKNFNSHLLSTHIKINTLLTDENIKEAILQVREYCVEEGCEHACITNGTVWIFFKTFERGKNWKDLRAFVIKDMKYFSENFIDAINKFSYNNLLSGSLRELIGSFVNQNREIYYPKEKINDYKKKVNSNKYVRNLRKIANQYFGVINVEDREFMNHCYVNQHDYEQALENFHLIIEDSLSPYFKEYGIQDFENNDKRGKFGNRIKRSLRDSKKGEILILFGGKGAGKSTFLRKLFFYDPPEYISNHACVSVVDLLRTPEQKDLIYNTIWEGIINNLDKDNLLTADRPSLLEQFKDKYETAEKQILFGLNHNSESYNTKLNDLLKEWLSDKKYCATRLVAYWKRKKKGSIIVIDNTDQYSNEIQDFCFSTAQDIAALLDCLVIVSMREERFYASNVHGTLDAFQNSGFHISSPVTSAVFKKRINYVLEKLMEQERIEAVYYDESDVKHIPNFVKLFRIFQNEFNKGDNSPLCEFLTACSHGNTRLALDLFRDLLQSGYTNVDEWITVNGLWTLKIHQVLKPFMIPFRFFYEETQSKIPNIYQIRSKSNGSHFTAVRILHRLCEGADRNNQPYVSVSELKDFFIENFNMAEDFEKNLDLLLKYNFVESNNRIDMYSEDVDNIKATNYGSYMYDTMRSYFTYLDLVCSDCGYFNESIANEIVLLSNEDLRLYTARKRLDRIQARLIKTEKFIRYLMEEEEKEKEYYQLKPTSMITSNMLNLFEIEKEAVIKSASKSRNQ